VFDEHEEHEIIFANESPPEPTFETITWQSSSLTLEVVTGIITDFRGTVSDDGTVPSSADWIELEIEKDDGTTAIIAGMNSTGFIFGRKPTHGMEITAYIAQDTPTFKNTPPIYIATAIITGIPPETSVTVLHNAVEPFSFLTTDETEFFFSESNHRIDADRVVWFRDSPAVVVHDTIHDGLPVAQRVVILSTRTAQGFYTVVHESPYTYHAWAEEIPENFSLSFRDYIFSADDFEVLDLSIFMNGEKIDSPPPILSADGTAILVPLRNAAAEESSSVGIPYFTEGGGLLLRGCGASSATTYWHIGKNLNYSMFREMEYLCVPPIIVGGVVYVPLSSHFPFTGNWAFDDRIEFYNTNTYPYGMQLGYVPFDEKIMTDEELAAMPIIVNGVEINSRAIFDDSPGSRDQILIPILHGIPVADDGEAYSRLRDLRWHGFNNIICDGQILINYSP
jgi:hypothetical protein